MAAGMFPLVPTINVWRDSDGTRYNEIYLFIYAWMKRWTEYHSSLRCLSSYLQKMGTIHWILRIFKDEIFHYKYSYISTCILNLSKIIGTISAIKKNIGMYLSNHRISNKIFKRNCVGWWPYFLSYENAGWSKVLERKSR